MQCMTQATMCLINPVVLDDGAVERTETHQTKTQIIRINKVC